MRRAMIRLMLYVVIMLVPVGVASLLGDGSVNPVHEAGKCAALIAFVIVFLQVLLVARIKWIEQAFGFDMVIRFHRNMALLAAVLLLSHPLLIAASEGDWKLLVGLDLPWYIWLGKIALVILVANILLGIYQKRLNLKFEQWRTGHNIAGLLIITLVFVHSWLAGDDLEPTAMKVLWSALLAMAVLLYLYHKIFGPLRRKNDAYVVMAVHQETADVWTIKMSPPAGVKIPPYLPGQFHFLTFYRNRQLPVEEHHWTISSSPAETGYVSSTIKELGDFTATIGDTRVGDKVAVQGAFGRFSYILHPDETDLVFIAGGIGITPLMSMLRHMRDTADNRSVVLLYANPEADKIVFRQELADLENSLYPRLTVAHVLERPSGDRTVESGYIDREKIERNCTGDLRKKAFYVCGPKQMRDAVIRDLKDLGVADGRIRMEIFSFLD